MTKLLFFSGNYYHYCYYNDYYSIRTHCSTVWRWIALDRDLRRSVWRCTHDSKIKMRMNEKNYLSVCISRRSKIQHRVEKKKKTPIYVSSPVFYSADSVLCAHSKTTLMYYRLIPMYTIDFFFLPVKNSSLSRNSIL